MFWDIYSDGTLWIVRDSADNIQFEHLYNLWKLYTQSIMMRATTKRPPVYL